MKEYDVGIVDVDIDYRTGKQSLVKSKDGKFYVVSSINMIERREEEAGLGLMDALLGITGDSETMIFLGLHPEKLIVKDGRDGKTFKSYNYNFVDLWCNRPADHDEGVKLAIEGNFDGMED